MIKAIVLDFDGVIVESEGIKNESFREAFACYPQHIDEIMCYHLEHKTVSRYDKFRHIVESILCEDCDEERVKEIDSQFSPIVRKKIIECPYVDGATEFLEQFSRRVPLYVASATPQGELEAIVAARGLDRYFVSVYGTPLKKKKILRMVLEREGLAPEAVAYIGDTRNDYEAAREVGVLFVGRKREEPFDDLGIPAYDSLTGVGAHLEKLVNGED